MNTHKTHKRTRIRFFSYITAAIIALAAWGIVQSVETAKYKKQLSIEQQRTISSLASYLDSIETDLKKMQYVNTETMASGLALSMSRAAAGAKNCLSELSSGAAQLYNINKFLSQTGDYIQSLNKRLTQGEELTAEDRAQIRKLWEYSASLSEKVSYMEEVMYSGEIRFEDTVSTLSMLSQTGDISVSYLDTISDAEESFSDYPTLIYDGPFSDNIESKESSFLKNKKAITAEEAKISAAKYSGTDKNKLMQQEDNGSHIESYVFYNDGLTVAVTKNGGYLHYILSDKYAGEEKLTKQQCVEKAKNYLNDIGYGDMKETYYFDEDGICTINFAYTHSDIIFYPDLIKVSVSLSDGKILSVDASTYLMNHKERSDIEFSVSAADAMSKISSELNIKQMKKACIPTDNDNEQAAYEFLCSDRDGNDILLYADAKTGNEVQILLLLYSDGGTLTK